MSSPHTHEHAHDHQHADHRHAGGVLGVLRRAVRAAVLVLAAIGVVTVVGMVRTAREPYGGPLEA
jgi:hypothetical protein